MNSGALFSSSEIASAASLPFKVKFAL